MKGSFRSIWRSLFPKKGRADHIKGPKRFEMPDPVLNIGGKHRRAVNRAARRRDAHMKWAGRDTRQVGNAHRQKANRKNLNRRRNKIAAASRRINRI